MYVSRHDLSPAELAAARRQQKRQRYLRSSGRPSQVTPEEFAQALHHVRSLHGRGLAFKDMQDQVDGNVSRFVFGKLASGRQKNLRRCSYDTIMKLRFEDPAVGDDLVRHGSLIPAHGTFRRIEALRALGFPEKFLAGWTGAFAANFRYRTSRTGVHLTVAARVDAMYQKLKGADPRDYGIEPSTIKRALTVAGKHGFAPPSCWDEDTIDDPAALPEWTGVCGTEDGAAVHAREGIPLCAPCRMTAPYRQLSENLPVEDFDRVVFRATYREQGYTALSLAAAAGCSPDSIYRWQSGERQPRKPALNKIADVLGVRPEELCADADVHD